MENYEKKIQALLKQMTLEEKVGQLQQCGPSLVGAFEVSFSELLNMMFDGRISQAEFGRLMAGAHQDFHEDDLRAGRIGSYNGISNAATANRLQKIAVEETVQLYIRDLAADRVRPVKQLKGFQKVAVKAGESVRVSFEVPFADLGYYDWDMRYRVDDGEYRVFLGGNSADTLETSVFLTEKP